MQRVICLFILILLTTSSLSAEERKVEQIYNSSCMSCHISGVANAPKTHDEEGWKMRKKTISEFIASAKKGLNAMPPMGLCSDCTDKEFKKVIEFMMKKK